MSGWYPARGALLALVVLVPALPARAEDGPALRSEAAEALRRATRFFTTKVSTEGGYLWRYREDLGLREGEGKASETMVWVQPPGTPSIGMTLLEAYQATGEQGYLDAARRAADCLVRGQLRSGGWDYRIEFDPKRRARYAYRVDAPRETDKQFNTTTLDDDTTQAALRLLMRVDRALAFQDANIHEAAHYALERLLEAQYPNGAWPQRFRGPPDPRKHPILRASYPDSWSRTFPKVDYKGFYTFNDNAMADVIDVLLEADRTYGDARYRAAVDRAGRFILLAQMPDPQPAWAQQYDLAMHPAWARKFEPPSITGGESQGILQTLLELYRQTGERRYLEPVPKALAYLRNSLLPGGRLARFYELKTNRPLYFTKTYELTYSDTDLPTHYSFKVSQRLEAIEREYKRLRQLSPEDLRRQREKSSRRSGPPSAGDIRAVKKVIASLDDQGRWVEAGRMKYHGDDDSTTRVIDCRTFLQNARTLIRYLQATSPRGAD